MPTEDSTEKMKRFARTMRRKFADLRYRNSHYFRPVDDLSDVEREPQPIDLDDRLVKERDGDE